MTERSHSLLRKFLAALCAAAAIGMLATPASADGGLNSVRQNGATQQNAPSPTPRGAQPAQPGLGAMTQSQPRRLDRRERRHHRRMERRERRHDRRMDRRERRHERHEDRREDRHERRVDRR